MVPVLPCADARWRCAFYRFFFAAWSSGKEPESVARLIGLVGGNYPPKAGAATYRVIPKQTALLLYACERQFASVFCSVLLLFLLRIVRFPCQSLISGAL
jgi:hypothetical protein